MEFSFNEFMERHAEEIGGQFSEYDQSKSVIIVPLGSKHKFISVTLSLNELFLVTSPDPNQKINVPSKL